jgi:hypothetical protein
VGSNPATPTIGQATRAPAFGRFGAMNPQTRIPVNVVIGRIASIVGLSVAVAFGILLLLSGTYWVAGMISFACALPFVGLLRFVEFRAERGRLRDS